jgi:DNA-binding MarR family transcriptional regulator
MVSLTASGRRGLDKLRSILQQVEDEVLEPLDAKDRSALRTLLLQLGQHEATDATVRAG